MRSSDEARASEAFICRERGLFWWADEQVPRSQFAPNNAIFGELYIDAEGRTTLDLDGALTTEARAKPALLLSDDPNLRGRWVRGKLKDTNRHVLFMILSRRNVRFATSNLSLEGFLASHCLVSEQEFPRRWREPFFSSIEVDLKGFEEWLRLGSIRSKRSKIALHVTYRHPKRIDYRIDGGTLSIVYDLFGPLFGDSRNDTLHLREAASLLLKQDEPVTITQAVAHHRLLQDLFVLLTDSTYDLDWPTLVTRRGQRCIMYFQRIISKGAAPRYFESPTNFAQLKDSFGKVFLTWRAKRESLGPALAPIRLPAQCRSDKVGEIPGRGCTARPDFLYAGPEPSRCRSVSGSRSTGPVAEIAPTRNPSAKHGAVPFSGGPLAVSAPPVFRRALILSIVRRAASRLASLAGFRHGSVPMRKGQAGHPTAEQRDISFTC